MSWIVLQKPHDIHWQSLVHQSMVGICLIIKKFHIDIAMLSAKPVGSIPKP